MLKARADFYALDRTLHSILYEAAELPHLIIIVGKLIESVETFLTLYDQERIDCKKVTEEHFEILQAIKTKDEARVVETVSKNIHSGLEVTKLTLSRLAQSGNPTFR